MSEHIYSITIGGPVTREGYDRILELLQEGTTLIPVADAYEDPNTDHLDIRPEHDFWSEDMIVPVRHYLEENALPYKMSGYSTVSDVDYNQYWLPGWNGPDSYDADRNWEDESGIRLPPVLWNGKPRPMKDWIVNVCRISYSNADIRVSAATSGEAEAAAEEEAHDHNFANPHTAEYRAQGAVEAK